jgi:hypothetical protein
MFVCLLFVVVMWMCAWGLFTEVRWLTLCGGLLIIKLLLLECFFLCESENLKPEANFFRISKKPSPKKLPANFYDTPTMSQFWSPTLHSKKWCHLVEIIFRKIMYTLKQRHHSPENAFIFLLKWRKNVKKFKWRICEIFMWAFRYLCDVFCFSWIYYFCENEGKKCHSQYV